VKPVSLFMTAAAV